jgi:hypothetical protein
MKSELSVLNVAGKPERVFANSSKPIACSPCWIFFCRLLFAKTVGIDLGDIFVLFFVRERQNKQELNFRVLVLAFVKTALI